MGEVVDGWPLAIRLIGRKPPITFVTHDPEAAGVLRR